MHACAVRSVSLLYMTDTTQTNFLCLKELLLCIKYDFVRLFQLIKNRVCFIDLLSANDTFALSLKCNNRLKVRVYTNKVKLKLKIDYICKCTVEHYRFLRNELY